MVFDLRRAVGADLILENKRSKTSVITNAFARNIFWVAENIIYIFPAFMSATRFSKFVVSTLSALPRAIAFSATVKASSFLPAANSACDLAERFWKVSLTLMD